MPGTLPFLGHIEVKRADSPFPSQSFLSGGAAFSINRSCDKDKFNSYNV